MKEIVDRLKLEIDDENEFISGVLGEISLIKNERIALEHGRTFWKRGRRNSGTFW